jgi:hypothetical protein
MGPTQIAVTLAAEEVPWTEIPAVRLLGAILGTILLIAAIKAMFGKGRR